MSDANFAYLQYISKFGQPPKRAGHLIKFAKESGIQISWNQATTLLANPPVPPTAHPPNIHTGAMSSDLILLNTQQFNRNFTRKRNTWNIRASSTSDASPINAWNLQTKIDPRTGQQYTSSQGLPPPPPNNHTTIHVPPPPPTMDIWTHKKHKKNKKHKRKISSRGVPPPPGQFDIWAPQIAPQIIKYASHSQNKSMTSPQLHKFMSYRQHSKHSKHKQSSSVHFVHDHKKKHFFHSNVLRQSSSVVEFDMDSLMRQIEKNSKQVCMMSSIVPKLFESQQCCHKFMTELSDQCISTYIAPAVLGDQFSNPDDPFAEFLHCMGLELKKFESVGNKYLDIMERKFVRSVDKLNDGGFGKVRKYYSDYKMKLNECSDAKNDDSKFFELSLLKLKLQNEMNVVQNNTHVELLNGVDLYWKSYRTLLKTQATILLQSKMRTQSIDAWHSDEDDDYFSQRHHAQVLNIDAIDDEVGFNNIYNDIVKYQVKLGKNKQYKRVIYVDKTNKIIKILTLKTEIINYAFHEIDKIEKEYNLSDMDRLSLRFNDNKAYFYQFESARKREEFTGELLEYGKNNNDLLSIFVGSWNVGDSEFDVSNIANWISKSNKHDIYIIGLQEVKSKLKNKWINGLLAFIDDANEYKILNKTFLMGIGIITIIHQSHIAKISHLQCQTVATGKGNIIGNKGATSVSFQFMESTFLFVNCHLAARAERFEKRAQNFTRIVKELNLGILNDVDVLHQFSHIIWFGDLNYRVEKDWNSVLKLVANEEWDELLKYDQLYHQMNFDAVFSGFYEGKISFCPTYRWNRDENVVSNKREQPPSYTDRILYKTLPNSFDLWQQEYQSSNDCFGSDHRPIFSIFKFKPRIPYFSYSFKRKYSKIKIGFAELKVIFTNNDVINSVDIKYPMEIKFYYLHSSPNQYILKNGQFMKTDNYFQWRSLELDNLKINPFVHDPSFICTTHIFCSFIQKTNIIGHCVISLFDTFPKTLLNTAKMKNIYFNTNKHLQTMNHDKIKKLAINENNTNCKTFNIKVSRHGVNIGKVEGMLCVDGKLIRKHMRYSTMATTTSIKKQYADDSDDSNDIYDDDSDDINGDDIKENNENNLDQWSCQYCTFLNINDESQICQVCGGHKDKFIYETQLNLLKDMGFNDEDKIKAHLMAQAGNVDRAAHNLLLSED